MLGWRDVPVESSSLGEQARTVMPAFRQLVIAGPAGEFSGLDLERRAYVVRKRIEHEVGNADHDRVYFPSLSGRTMVYKGMLTVPQLGEFFPDLGDERMESALALVHSRSHQHVPAGRCPPLPLHAHHARSHVKCNPLMRPRDAVASAFPNGRRLPRSIRAAVSHRPPAASDAVTSRGLDCCTSRSPCTTRVR